MTGGMESVGDAVTGGMIARAVEARTGEAEGHDGSCLNCGTALIGAYCHRCGQSGHVHRTLTAFWHDLAHGVLHFEGKIWRTLPLLAWRPGELTRRYIHGERARFVSPLALFLFTVFFMFAVISALGGHLETPDTKKLVDGVPAAQVRAEIKTRSARLAALDRQRDAARAAGRNVEALDAEREKLKDSIADDREALKAFETMGMPKPNQIHSDIPWLDHALKKAAENPNLLLYKLQTSAYKFSWALIPISVPFLWLLFFWRPRYKLYDHAIFVTYSLSFMMMLVVVLTVGGRIGLAGGLIATAALLIPPIHIYRQLRGAYATSRFGAFWRTCLLCFFATIALTLFAILLIVMGVTG